MATEYPRPDEIAAYLETRNWVVARRTPRIVERYGADVVCLSLGGFKKLQQQILANRAA